MTTKRKRQKNKLFKLIKFWYTDLSKDSDEPWFMCYLDYGIEPNGNPKITIRKGFKSLRFWKIRLVWELMKVIIKTNEV